MNSKLGLVLWASLLALNISCLESPTLKQCVPECSRGTICNEADGLCVRTTQKTFTGNISGRAFDLIPTKDTIFLSAQNDSGSILVSEFSESVFSNNVIIADFENNIARKTAIDANDTTLVVAWRESDRYVVAFREIRRSRVAWQFQALAGVYRASDDFDLVHVGGRFSLVFRDLAGGVSALDSEVLENQNWSLTSVDDGRQQVSPTCESSSVGFDLSAISREGQLLVAYHDRSCGVLKIARKEKGEWNASVVDAGDLSTRAQNVGRQPALAVNDEGEVNISYLSGENTLLFSAEKEGSFEREIVDDGKNTDVLSREVLNQVGAFSSILAIDQSTKIVYFDGTEQRLLLAKKTDGNWELEPLLEGLFIVGMNSKIVNFGNTDWVFSEKLEREVDFVSTLIAIELEP